MKNALSQIFRLLTDPSQVPRGWNLIEGLGEARANPRGWAILWWAVMAGRGYEQPMILEAPGAMVIVRDDQGRIAFVEQHRAQRPRLPEALTGSGGLGYIALLVRDNLFGKLEASSSGSISYELPAGLVDPKDIQPGISYEQLVTRIGEREASEEAGLRVDVTNVHLDTMNANPVFFLHPHSVVVGTLVSTGKATPDAEEAIKGRVWLTEEQIRARFASGELYDARTIAALAIAGIRFA